MTKYKKYIILLSGVLLCAAMQVKAQQAEGETYSGRIVNSNGKSIPSVVVTVKRTGVATSSGKNGEFVVAGIPGDTLEFAKEGYRSLFRVAGKSTAMSVIFGASDVTDTDEEYVGIPFGKRTKRELNYAVSGGSTDDLPKLPVSNLTSLLAGRYSGLLVQLTGHQPGVENVAFQVRGKSAYAQGGAPVILVDGVERDFTDMDLTEIENISVLKDAASLNWYGLNAGNGAILVNTRHGKANQNFINFDVLMGFQSASKYIKPLNSYDFATLYNQGLSNVGQNPAYNQQALDAYKDHTDPYLFPDNNYLERFLGRTAPVQRYNLSLGGGSERVRYYTTISYYNQEGLFKETKTSDYDANFSYKRYNFRVNLDYDVTKTLSLSLLGGLRSERRYDMGDRTSGVLNTLYNLPPNAFPILNADSSYGGTSVYQNNPLGQIQSTGTYNVIANILNVSLAAKQKLDIFTEGLSANIFFSYDGYGNYSHGFTKNYAVVNQTVTPNQTYRTPAVLAYRYAGFGTSTKNNQVWLGLDYDRTFAQKHKVTASVRAQQSVSAAVDRIDYRGRLFVARADYGFNDRYFVGFTGSYSGSENYAPGRRFGFFPAVSAGWVISDEAFLKNTKWLNYLKLRGSYGRTGNLAPTYDANGNWVRLPYRALFTRGGGPILGSAFSATSTAYEVSPTGNPLTTWEKIDRLNIGADVSLFNNELSLSADVFDEKRIDILNSANMPGILGVAVSAVNYGQASSKGFDMGAVYQKHIKDFHVIVNANFTYAANKVLRQSLPSGTLEYQSPVGHNIGNVSVSGTKRFYVSEGLFQTQNEIDNSPKQTLSGLVVPGDIKYKDINGDNIIDSRDAVNTDYTDIPNVYYGFGLNVRYKLFDISAQFQGVHGRTIDIKSVVYAGPNSLNQLSKEAWTIENAATARYPRIGISDNGNNTANSDFWLRSGDFVKLRTIEFGISLPEKIAHRLRMQSARLFAGGYNLLTFSKLSGLDIDAETPDAGIGSNYPYMKTYTLGLSVKF